MSAPTKIPPPNYTQIPNALIALIPDMSESELRVSIIIARKTFGWHKHRDRISLSQLVDLTGLSKQAVINGIEQGLERGTIERIPDGQSFSYSLLVNVVDQNTSASQPSGLALVNVVDQSLVNVVDTQKKQEKERKEKNRTAAPPPKTDFQQDEPPTPNIFKLYENLGLFLNPTIAEILKEAEDEFSSEWIHEAFKRAASGNKRNWNYIHAILKNWKAAGGIDDPQKPKPETSSAPPQTPAPIIQETRNGWKKQLGIWLPPSQAFVEERCQPNETFLDALDRLTEQFLVANPNPKPTNGGKQHGQSEQPHQTHRPSATVQNANATTRR